MWKCERAKIKYGRSGCTGRSGCDSRTGTCLLEMSYELYESKEFCSVRFGKNVADEKVVLYRLCCASDVCVARCTCISFAT